MGRQVRRVPADWQHPKREDGRYIPLRGGSYAIEAAEWDEEKRQWDAGYVSDYKGGWEPKRPDQDYSYDEYAGERPAPEEFMPDWPQEQRTHWQMYEDTSEGTPISPVLETPEALARWLADTRASAFGDMTATYEQWLATIRQGWAVGMVLGADGLKSGVEAMT